MLKKILNIFSNSLFLFASTTFRLIMKNNFTQMATSAGHPVAYMIGPIFKHIIDYMQLYLRWSWLWSWRVWKQVKLLRFGHTNPAHKHSKADAPKMSLYLVWILVHKHNWAMFLRKWRYSQWWSLPGHVECIFVNKN